MDQGCRGSRGLKTLRARRRGLESLNVVVSVVRYLLTALLSFIGTRPPSLGVNLSKPNVRGLAYFIHASMLSAGYEALRGYQSRDEDSSHVLGLVGQ